MTDRSDPLLFQNFNNKQEIYFSNGEKINIDEFSCDVIKSAPFWYSVKIEDFTKLSNSDYFQKFKKPYLIYHNGFECPQMSIIQFNDKEIKLLNQEGLHIFLTENLVKYTGDRKFVSKQNLKDKIHEFKFGVNTGVYENLRCAQFDSIQDLVRNNNLKNVHVYTIELDVDIVFSKKYPELMFHWKDTYIFKSIADFTVIAPVTKLPPRFKFINFNWRYDFYRDLVVSYLATTNSKFSWYYKSDIEKIKSNLWFDINKWKDSYVYSRITAGMKFLNENVPINLDKAISNSIELSGTMSDMLKLPDTEVPPFINSKVFEDVFCAVVTESVFLEPTSSASEKTLFAIYNKTPFISVGPPGTLKYLRKLGFKTFDDFWNEDYDNELDHESRLLKIFQVIDFIDNKSLSELNQIYDKMQSILNFNYHRLLELKENNLWLDQVQ